MSKIISIHSYRGGTGKSNSTANLAASLACAGNRVGIVDTDLPSPGIHVLFGFDESKLNKTLNDFLWGRCPAKDAAYDVTSILGKMATPESALYLIPASVRINDISKILREGYDVELLNDGFQDLLEQLKLDYLFIDTHPGLSEETLLSLTVSDLVILILRPDQQDFQGTAVTIDVARKLDVQKLLLLVNKALPEFDFNELQKKIADTFQVQVGGVLPESSDIIRLASSGIFCLNFPDHQISKVYRHVASLI